MSEKTFGEKIVRTDFNPAKTDEVNLLKQKTAELINIVESLREKDPRLADFAIKDYEQAAMWAVKLATA